LETNSRVATLAGGCGLAAATGFALGPAAIQVGLVSPYLGFGIFMLGSLLALLALVFGVAGLWSTRPAAGRGGRSRATLGTLLGTLVVGTILVLASSGAGVPPINDITTDLESPPEFAAAGSIEANQGRDMGYPGEEFARQQRAGYPDLAPIVIIGPPRDAYQRALETSQALGWEITARDPKQGRIEAVETTLVFRFVDDIVVRVRANPGGGSIIDVRSKSRDGRSDMGANAARIREFGAALTR